MRNSQQWKSGFVESGGAPGAFRLNPDNVYAGSRHIAQLQVEAYLPVLHTYARGRLLDAGCGSMPYYDVYRHQCGEITCLDHDPNNRFADQVHDLNTPLPFPERSFDTILLLDVVAHVYKTPELIRECSRCLETSGHLIITTPFIYWPSMHPHDYFHPSESALRAMCADAALEIVHLGSYGGYPDVLLDTLNKGMTGRISHRLFRLLASLVKNTGWYRRSRVKTLYSYPLGYTVVARRI